MKYVLLAAFLFEAPGCVTDHDHLGIDIVYFRHDSPRGGKIVFTKDTDIFFPENLRKYQSEEKKIIAYACGTESYRIVDEGIEIPQGEVADYSLPRDQHEKPYVRRQYRNFVCEGKPLDLGK